MQKIKFYKEVPGRWYVDLPDWQGPKADLEMVEGADNMLEYAAEGECEVYLNISENNFDGADVLEFISMSEEIGNGAYYKLEKYKGIEINLKMWLCDVCQWHFGKFPNKIYIQAT